MRRFVAPLAALAVVACGGSGTVREPAELQSLDKPELKPRVVWDASPGDGSGDLMSRLRIAVEQDMLVTADVDGNVYALNPASGKVVWEAETEARIIAGPSVAGNLVLVGTLDAEVIALKRADGAPAWRAPVSSEVLAPPVSDGVVVVVRCSDGRVFGLSAETGARVWSFDRSQPQLLLRGMSAPLIDGDTVYLGLDNGRAVALRIASGELLWEQVVAAPTGRNDLDRIADIDGEMVLASGGLFSVSYGGEIAAISVEDGRVAWRRPIKSYTGIAPIGTQLIVTDEEGMVWALDAQTGAAAWKQEALKYRKLSTPAVIGDHIVVADFEGYLHWLAPNDGRIVARVRAVDDPVTAALAIHEERLYVLDADGDIAAVEAGAVN